MLLLSGEGRSATGAGKQLAKHLECLGSLLMATLL